MNASEIRATLSLGGIFALRMLGLFMIIPVFSIYGADYTSATPMLIGLAIGIYGLAQASLQIPVSMLADRLPRKPIIIIGLLLFALGGAVAATATDIWQVIGGRFIAGAGAVSAVVMALLADVTREQSRSKAMAGLGFMIALSIVLAFVLGPWLAGKVGMSGLFWVTAIAGVLAIVLVLIAPTPQRTLRYNLNSLSMSQQLGNVLRMGNLNRLYVTVFTIHLLITALFVLVPLQLERFGYSVGQHSWIYLPLLLVGFALTVPFIIVAEKYRKMRQIVLTGIACLALALGLLVFAEKTFALLVFGMGIFVVGFNLLESIIPSWVSKQAPVVSKSTAMGVSATSQFMGSFLGGVLGGFLLTQPYTTAWMICAAIACIALVLVWGIGSPPYLTSLTVSIPKTQNFKDEKITDWQTAVQSVLGVEDLVLLPKDGVAYLKIDKKKFTDETRHQLSQLINRPLDF